MSPAITRRTFLTSLVGLAAGPLAARSGEFLEADLGENAILIMALQDFVDAKLLLYAARCGTCQGSDTPAEPEVEQFMQRLIHEQWRGRPAVEQYLAESNEQDLAEDQLVTVQGWVLTRTESLASACFAILTGGDCRFS